MGAFVAIAGLTGVGLLGFWAWGILGGGITGGAEPWPGFRDHELAFALPDCTVGAVLLAGAVLEAIGDARGRWVAGPAGRALMFLGLLDLAYLYRTWRLRSGAMRVRTAVLASAALLLGGVLVVLVG